LNDDQKQFTSRITDNIGRLFNLEGRTAVVTGAASGLGKRMGTVLVAAGARVYFADIDEAGASVAAQEARAIGSGGAHPIGLDVTDSQSLEDAFGQISKQTEGVEILVCSAGISRAKWIEEMTTEMWKTVLEINLTGTFLCCKEAAKSMIPRRWGRIVNIASIAATHAPKPKRFDGGYNYSASKAGVIGMTKRLAVELAPYNITANCISPGIMETPLTRKALAEEDTLRQVLDSVPMRRVGRPSDLDGLVVFLCSESSGFLTGQDILVDGGYSVW
jgi:3-oxoacyl-[acyl-carrier protein] reductase